MTLSDLDHVAFVGVDVAASVAGDEGPRIDTDDSTLRRYVIGRAEGPPA